MPQSTETRIKEEASASVFDAGFFLRASQRHVHPHKPAVVELIQSELKESILIIQSMPGLHLSVGKEPIEAVKHEQASVSTVTVEPGTQLAIQGVEEQEIIAATEDDDQLLRLQPQVIARTLINGGELFTPQVQIDDLEAGSV